MQLNHHVTYNTWQQDFVPEYDEISACTHHLISDVPSGFQRRWMFDVKPVFSEAANHGRTHGLNANDALRVGLAL
jgi:hypothetical protein